MFTLSTLIITAIAALLIGGALGAILTKSLHPDEKQNRELENRVNKAEDKLKDYQQDVTEHFAQTSQLVNSLTQSYKEVHEYLADSALKLTNPDISRQLIDAADGKLLPASSKAKDTSSRDEHGTMAPRDWAPRGADGKGQLSEDFGLDPHPSHEDNADHPLKPKTGKADA
ncbi:YhcB family protein [Pseudomaricurvus sp.]|uniref:YhcB family protein n=1 Tax=Pseudomaricurvus sp. TaxID=2004510 RepID=UPI003F6CF677